MVQKMIGAIIILISAMKPVPSGFRACAKSGATSPRMAPSTTAAMTAMYRMWVLSFFGGAVALLPPEATSAEDAMGTSLNRGNQAGWLFSYFPTKSPLPPWGAVREPDCSADAEVPKTAGRLRERGFHPVHPPRGAGL